MAIIREPGQTAQCQRGTAERPPRSMTAAGIFLPLTTESLKDVS